MMAWQQPHASKPLLLLLRKLLLDISCISCISCMSCCISCISCVSCMSCISG